MFNKNIIKKEVNTKYSGKLVCIGDHIFSNKAKVTLILHTVHSENYMNMTMGKCVKRSIILNHKFIV